MLFRRVIMLSGSPLTPLTGNSGSVALHNANSLADILGCSVRESDLHLEPQRQRMVQCLRKRAVSSMVLAANQLATSNEKIFYGPSIEGDYPWKLGGKLDKYKPIDILVGSTKHEGTLYVTELMQLFGLAADQTLTPRRILATFRNFLEIYGVSNVEPIIDHYGFRNISFLNKLGQLLMLDIAKPIGDFLVYCPILYFMEAAYRAGSRVFFYEFGYSPNYKLWPSWQGVPQFLDFVFATGLLNVLERKQPVYDQDWKLSQDMAEMFAGFAKTG